MATDVRVQEYEIAERRLFQKFGLEYRSHYFQLGNTRLRARVIEAGSGPPVLFVHGDGGVASGWVPLLSEIKGYRLLAAMLTYTVRLQTGAKVKSPERA
ncbi:MAG: hypothetical protein HYY01_05815 [Chloroflexi bacterium]|nr:hypothetical protein [Chloroflexota bacterium]